MTDQSRTLDRIIIKGFGYDAHKRTETFYINPIPEERTASYLKNSLALIQCGMATLTYRPFMIDADAGIIYGQAIEMTQSSLEELDVRIARLFHVNEGKNHVAK